MQTILVQSFSRSSAKRAKENFPPSLTLHLPEAASSLVELMSTVLQGYVVNRVTILRSPH